MRQPDAYRTEPLAVWGLVLAILLWPVGLVVSLVALRRVRRSGDQGWGMAAAGVALSAGLGLISVIALAWFVATSGITEQWAREREQRAVVQEVRAAVDDVAAALTRQHEETGAWPASVRGLDVSPDDVQVEAYRDGDLICVEGATNGAVASTADGETVDGLRCADRGFASTLPQVAAVERAEAEAEELATAVAQVRGWAEQTAARSSLGEPPAGVPGAEGLSVPVLDQRDLRICAAVDGALDHLGDALVREALAVVVEEIDPAPEDVEIENLVYGLRAYLAEADSGDGEYWSTVRTGRWSCHRGGYVGPEPYTDGSPFPAWD